MSDENNSGPGIEKQLSADAIRSVAQIGLELIAEKYQLIDKRSQKNPVYYIEQGHYEGESYIELERTEQSYVLKRICDKPEMVYIPVKVTVNSNDRKTNILIGHEFWEKEAEFLINFMREVIPEYVNKENIIITTSYLPAEKKGKLEEVVAKYEKQASDKW